MSEINYATLRDLQAAFVDGDPVIVTCDPEAIPGQDKVGPGRILCLTYSKVQYEEARGAQDHFDEYDETGVIVDTDLGFVHVAIENVHGVRKA